MLRNIATIAIVVLTLGAAPAAAQDVVLAVGDEGVVTAVEAGVGSVLVARAGVVHHTERSDVDEIHFAGSLGYRVHGDSPLSADVALAVEEMQPGPDGDIDYRLRVGLGYDVTKNSTAVFEASRSFVNDTDYSRVSIGLRLGL